jgi:5'-nucleotidase
MFRDMRPRSRALIAATTLGLIASPLALNATASANPAGTSLVISEVYGGGNNSGAAFNADFVELYNPTGSAISLGGKSIQYRSAGGTGAATNVFALPAVSVPAGKHFLVSGAGGTTNGAALPTADASSGLNLSGTGGQVYLADSVSGIDPNTPAGAGGSTFTSQVIDFVGWGTSTTTSFEGTRAAATTNGTSISRNAAGADTDVNSADFAVANPPVPENCDCAATPGEFTGTIAQIQGTDAAASPHAGDIATTTGVVTATYPTGGFNGFYLQTAGTGGASDTTPGASDAIFVFGSDAMAANPVVGEYLQVVGPVSEFGGLTEITPAAGGVTRPGGAFEPVVAQTSLPGSACTLGSCPTASELTAAREAHEGELFAPTASYVVQNSYSLTNGANGFMEIGLAASDKPLVAPTEVVDAQNGNVAERTAYNNAHAIVLDDGSSLNYTVGAKDLAMPWITKDHAVRVGAAADFTGNVVLDFRNSTYKLQPTSQVTGLGADTITFEQTRAGNAAPANVGGDLKLGTFNVLNYFNTTGQDYNTAHPGACTFFNDRAGNPVTVNTCTPTGPRGAARTEDFLRQQAKIVTAINTMDADIVSLEEIENSVALGEANRDDALSNLVSALNTAAGSTRWAYAPSPSAANLPALAEQDVIRTAFIYDPSTVDLVGASKVLVGSAPFSNAREPLAQAFKPDGAARSTAFGVIVNHFKSKGSGTDDGTGQGNANPDRVAQANALVTFANDFKQARGINKLFLTGDFNAYSEEDPIQVLEAAGYTNLESDTAGEESYSFSGLSGSLDHVMANAAALPGVAGVDIWDINAGESIAYQYGRYNYNATDFFDGTKPFGASDHNPEIVGINAAPAPTGPVDVQIIGTNDFHGRILNNTSNGEAGAAVLSGAVKQLRTQNPNTVFAAAGDLIGASTFESFIQKDKPTIDALNEAGLEVSAAGNHEFDAGYDDLVNRVMKPYDATTNKYGGAEWQYIAANVRKKSDNTHALPDTWMKTVGGVQVGFVGAVTEDLPSLVSPDGIADIKVTDIVDEANASADKLKADGADVIVLLVHEGAATTSYASATDPNSAFGQIVNGVDGDVDAIVSGHTHLSYNHAVPVQSWIDEGRPVTTRPVVSAGQYGTFLDKIVFTVDPVTGDVLAKTQDTLALKTGQTANYPVDAETKAIVDDAVAQAGVLGAQVLGQIGGPFNRAKLANGTTENRGGESTLGNLVAEVQRWATESETAGSAQIAFMNPGGLRADMVGVGTGAFPRDLNYRQAAEVQPFANTLVNLKMTGAQIKKVLEQQWQRDAGGNVPTRPFLRLGTSEGFRYTYDQVDDPAHAGFKVGRVTGMWLNGTKIDLSQTYSVTANSFLASGGDNFWEFGNVTNKRDTGKSDLTAMVDYMAEFTDTAPLPVDYKQHAVGVTFPAGAPASYKAGDHVVFDLSSLAYSTAADTKDSQVKVSLGDTDLGTFPVDNTIGTAVYDEYGTASVDVVLPAGTPGGGAVLTVTGLTTGTTVTVPLATEKSASTVSATADDMVYGTDGSVTVTVTPSGATGEVTLLDGTTELGHATLSGGTAEIAIPGTALEVGSHALTVEYAGDASHLPSTGTVTVDVEKAQPTVTVTANPSTVKVKKGTSRLDVTVAAAGFTPGGFAAAYYNGELLAYAPVTGGKVSLTVGPFDTIGAKSIQVRYYGDQHTLSADKTATVTVQKATPKISVTHSPSTVKVDKTRATLKVDVSAPEIEGKGKVTVTVGGKVVATRYLTDGTVSVLLPKFTSTGSKTVKVDYAGSGLILAGSTTHTVKVVR